MKVNNDSPFLKLVGTWQTSGKVFQTNSTEIELKGTDRYELILNGHCILHKADVQIGSSRSETIEIIRLDGKDPKSEMRFYDSSGDSGVMTGIMNGNEFSIEGDGLRFQGKFDNGDTLITGTWFKISESGDWKPFIDLELKRNNLNNPH